MTATLLISLGGLLIAALTLVISRRVARKDQVLVHRAKFLGSGTEEPDCYFITVTYLSLNREVEITHVWFGTPVEVNFVCNDRPLPKRLRVDEVWSTWVPVVALPVSLTDDEVYKLALVRLSSGKVFKSKQNKSVPGFGSVPGGGW